MSIGIIALSLLAYLLLRTSSFQTYLTSQISNHLSKELNTTISVEKVDISWFMDIVVEGVYMEDLKGNPLLVTDAISVDVNLLHFFKRELFIENIHLTKPLFAYRRYKGEESTNLQFLIDYFQSDSPDTTSSLPWNIQVSGVSVEEAEFIYDTEEAPFITDGFDYNHMHLSKVTGKFTHMYFPGDSLFIRINDLSAYDQSGLQVNHLQSDFIIANGQVVLPEFSVKTNASRFQGKATFAFEDISSWTRFITDIKMDVTLDSSYIAMDDITFFSPSLKGMDDLILVDGRVYGTVDKLRAKDILVAYDLENWFYGDIKLHGLPDIEHSFIMFNADKLRTNPTTISNLHLPGGSNLELPDELKRLGKVSANGRFTGFLTDFVAKMQFKTDLGKIVTDLSLKPLEDKNELAYEGNFSTSNLALNELLQTDRFGKVTMNGKIKGEGLDANTYGDLYLNIQSLGINSGIYEDIKLNAHLESKVIKFDLVSGDDRFLLNSYGSYNYGLDLPEAKLHAQINNARLSRVLLNNHDTLGEISTTLSAFIKGNKLDNLIADIQLDSTLYAHTSQDFFVKHLLFQTDFKDTAREVYLSSDYLDAQVKGISDIYELEENISLVMDKTLPRLLQDTLSEKTFLVNAKGTNNLDIKLNFKETELINLLFLPNMELAPGTLLESQYDASNDVLNLELTAPYFNYANYSLKNIHLEANKENKITYTHTHITSALLSDSLRIDSIILSSLIEEDTIFYHFHAGNHDNHKIQADLDGRMSIIEDNHFEMQFQDAYFWLSDTLFEIENNNKLWFSSEEIGAHDFKLYSKGSSIQIDGAVNKAMSDSLKIAFTNFDLNHADRYTQEFYTDFDGILNGELILNNIYDYVDFLSEIDITQFKLNGIYLGTSHLNTTWNKNKNAAIVNMSIQNQAQKPFHIYGYYYPTSTTNNYNLNLDLDKFPANALEPYLSSFSSELKGLLDGQLSIVGKTAAPEFNGRVHMNINKFKVDYLNTYYSFDDYMVFTPNKISFKDVTFYDQQYNKGDRNTALSQFSLTHNKFQDIAIDIKIAPNRMMCLNTSSQDNEMFYGTAFGTGSVHISGPLTNLNFNVDVETKLGTKVSIPIISNYDAKKADFITFISADQDSVPKKEVPKESETEYLLTMDLMFKLRPSATIRIVMDETSNDVLEAKGTGDIRMTIDADENVAMYGTYEITEGKYEIYSKSFDIDNGSKLSWDGDIEKAQLDIRAIHRVRTDISDLIESDSSALFTEVDCIIHIAGDLYSPEITFDIQTPNIESYKQDQIQNYLSVGGEKSQDIINRNFVYLLILGEFQPQQQNQATSGEGGQFMQTKSATDLIASQISNQLNKLSEDVDIGVEWNANEENTQQFAVVLSSTLWNDKIIINSKVGGDIATGENATTENKNRLVGDVKIEYKLQENLRLQAYNETNYENPVTRKSDYTQGAGIVWRKEFDHFNLFRKKEKKKKETHTSNHVNDSVNVQVQDTLNHTKLMIPDSNNISN